MKLAMHAAIRPANSTHFIRERKLELMLVKAERGRWPALLAPPAYVGNIKVDWTKYLDPEDELDEEEQKSGVRGPPVVGDTHLAKGVADYFRTKRQEQAAKAEPDMQALMKQAERLHAVEGGDFTALFKRLYNGAKRDLEAILQRETELDAEAEQGLTDEAAARKRRSATARTAPDEL